MPKLKKSKATKVNKAESGFKPLDEGMYTGVLTEVISKEGPKGEYWRWEFSNLETIDGEPVGGKQWVNTSLAENAEWKLKEMFEAFGVDASTDTDELTGERVVLVISQREIEKGTRAGEIGNQIDRVLSPEAVDAEAEDDEDEEEDEEEE